MYYDKSMLKINFGDNSKIKIIYFEFREVPKTINVT